MPEELFIWTIYKRDDKYVAKKFRIASEPVLLPDQIVHHDLTILRQLMREKFGLYPLGRMDGDAVDIVESWI